MFSIPLAAGKREGAMGFSIILPPFLKED